MKYTYVLSFGGGLGDAYIHLVTLRALQEIFQERFVLITTERNKDLYKEENFSKIEIIELSRVNDNDGKLTAYSFNMNYFNTLLDNCDVLIDLNPWYMPFEYKDYIEGSTCNTLGRFKFFKTHIPYDCSQNIFDSTFLFAKYFNDKLDIRDFAYPPQLGVKAKNFLEKVQTALQESLFLFGIQDETKDHKLWNPGSFEDLIDRLLDRYNNAGVIVLSRKTTIDLDKIRNKQRVISFGSPRAINEFISLMHIVDLFIGIDSVFLHLTNLFKVPTIGIFGPTDPVEWGLKFTQGEIVVSKSGKTEDIPVALVEHAVNRLIEQLNAQNQLN